ncbi:Predicted transcriptional regulator, containsd two HTH domains [Methanolobus vulcani]|uniref:Predicted transcriptional regulator, containsd two HTH domains n=1 Tax=Methanolobus vulcani TaxID=38026 RepID=A0A7Z7B3P6_9EURY|nr:Predicted transcriptional regulator, containsd two HTH domains [Methanolobus vulcani]
MKIRLSNILKILVFLLLIVCGCLIASAEPYVTFEPVKDIPRENVHDTGCDVNLTFRDLPLKLKFIWVGCTIWFLIVSLGKFIPLILGKMACKKGEKNRKKILSYVSENPGCSESDILSDLEMKRGTFRYHVDKLQLSNLLVAIRQGRFINYFSKGNSNEKSLQASVSNTQSDTRKCVLETICEEPGVTGKELSEKIGVDKSTIHWHITKLKDENAIRDEKDGRYRKYYPASNFSAIQDNNNNKFAVMSD